MVLMDVKPKSSGTYTRLQLSDAQQHTRLTKLNPTLRSPSLDRPMECHGENWSRQRRLRRSIDRGWLVVFSLQNSTRPPTRCLCALTDCFEPLYDSTPVFLYTPCLAICSNIFSNKFRCCEQTNRKPVRYTAVHITCIIGEFLVKAFLCSQQYIHR